MWMQELGGASGAATAPEMILTYAEFTKRVCQIKRFTTFTKCLLSQ